MRFRRALAPLATLVLALACARAPAPAPAPVPATPEDDARPYVVLVSFDGFRADFLDRHALPSFRRLAERGVRARAMLPSFPSKTFPNHYTLVTGLHPGEHGIVANTFWDPARGRWFRLSDRAAVTDSAWYGGEPLWVAAERAGMRTASVMWPGSEAAIRGVRPSTWMAYDEGMPDSTRVDSVAAWLRRPAASRPHFVSMYVSSLDYVSHRAGPDAPETARALQAADRALGRLLDSLAASPVGGRVNVVVVSDHGMRAVSNDRLVDLSRWVSLEGVRVADPGPVLSLWFDGDSARRDAVHAALARGLAGAPARVYRRGETPARWHLRDSPRAGDLLVVADDGWVVVPARPREPVRGGNHGWDVASAPEMAAIFVAAGPEVRARGTVPAFPNVDLYPLLARLLRVAPAAGVSGSDALARAVAR